VLDYLERGADGDQELIGRYGSLLETIQYLLPDLSRLDWRTWPMYGVPVSDAAVFYGLLMGAGYVLLLLAMAVITFGRREFF